MSIKGRENSLLNKIDPYYQARVALDSVEEFGCVSTIAYKVLDDLSEAFRKGVADAVRRLHKHYHNKKMPLSLNAFQIMKDVYGEDGWF